MEKIDDSKICQQSERLANWAGPRPEWGWQFSRDISLLDFDSDTNRRIPSPEAIQANSDKGNKQPNACHMERQGYV